LLFFAFFAPTPASLREALRAGLLRRSLLTELVLTLASRVAPGPFPMRPENGISPHMKTPLLFCSFFCAASLAHSEDQKSVQIKGQGNAAGTAIVLNQIAMDQFPAVHIFATVLKDGKPQSGLTAQ
jgi:hypothetical protein